MRQRTFQYRKSVYKGAGEAAQVADHTAVGIQCDATMLGRDQSFIDGKNIGRVTPDREWRFADGEDRIAGETAYGRESWVHRLLDPKMDRVEDSPIGPVRASERDG